jgi:3-deoxy-D-manno-octulosonate 8-phosphate phosphatase (KDO 8-P phosphatase)
MGYLIFMITGGSSKEMKNCLENLGVTCVYLSSQSKLKVYTEVKLKHGFRDEQVLYMGDDIPDYLVMQKVGLPTCPQDAVQEIKGISKYISHANGGKGAVRDVIEQVLKVQGKWMDDFDAKFF